MAYILGLENLIAGVTPTFVGWDTDPTDAANITDGDISTLCTTGTSAMAAWAPTYFEWDLGTMHNVLVSGVGNCGASAGTPQIFPTFYNGSAWITWTGARTENTPVPIEVHGAMCSKVRIGLCSSDIANITPNIREFHVWRL